LSAGDPLHRGPRDLAKTQRILGTGGKARAGPAGAAAGQAQATIKLVPP
jgi:hypothetical protein